MIRVTSVLTLHVYCRNKILDEKIQIMNMHYCQVCEERNELRRLLSEKRRQLKDQVKVNM